MSEDIYRLIGNKKHRIDCSCMACRMKIGETKGEKNYGYITGISMFQHYCSCGNQMSYNAKICRQCKNKIHSELLKGQKRLNFSGIFHPFYNKKRQEQSEIMSGKNNPKYIDGRTSLYNLIKNLHLYKEWRKKIYERDNYICQECYIKGNVHNLDCHHNYAFSLILNDFLQLYNQFSPLEDKETLVRLSLTYIPFWDINNGKTLCKDCHKLTKTYAGGK